MGIDRLLEKNVDRLVCQIDQSLSSVQSGKSKKERTETSKSCSLLSIKQSGPVHRIEDPHILVKMEARCNAAVLVLLVLLQFSYSCTRVDAQFFTKSSSSIPRMGRRSDQSLSGGPFASNQRAALVDMLVDEVAPAYLMNSGGNEVSLNYKECDQQSTIFPHRSLLTNLKSRKNDLSSRRV